ncbi:MAG: NAD(P)-dependent alcohol dehydrogenase [Pseudomonadota bacterium]
MAKPKVGLGSLRMDRQESASLGRSEIRVSIKANSINARDIMAITGQSPLPLPDEIIPVSDGAGIVSEIGEDVRLFAPGDRVVIAFNPTHQDGPFKPEMALGALGEVCPGVLASEVILEESALVKLPETVSFEQAACLPCVAVTAWNALFELGSLLPGQTAMAVGTGSVAMTALQLAKTAGIRFGITSSDDSKIEEAKSLGADFGVNYRSNPNWSEIVREATGGMGANVILETAGPPSIAESVRACAQNGRVMQIGLKAMEGPPVQPLDLLVGGVSILPVMVGSRAVLERLVAAVAFNKISFPIQSRFAFSKAPEAFASFLDPVGFGKTIISHETGDYQ